MAKARAGATGTKAAKTVNNAAGKTKRGAKPKPAPAATKKTAAGPHLLVDKALKARWEEAITRYRSAKTAETTGWDEEFEALGDIVDSDPPYYLAGGYKTAREFIAVELPGIDERTLRRNIRVARNFDPADEVEHGITKLDVFLDYLENVGGAPVAPAKIHLARQVVKITTGKSTRSVPFEKVSVDEIRAETRRQRNKADGPTRVSPAVKAVLAELKKEGLPGVSVSIRNNELTFGRVAVGKLAAFARAMSRARV